MAFQITIKKDTFEGSVTQHIATTTATNSESELDDNDGHEPRIEDIEAYQVMYNNWLKVCKENKSSKEKIVKLTKKK